MEANGVVGQRRCRVTCVCMSESVTRDGEEAEDVAKTELRDAHSVGL